MLLQILLFLFPWSIRRRLLRTAFKFNIHTTARIGLSIIRAKRFTMEQGSAIGNFTYCKKIDHFHVGKNSFVGTNVYITGFSVETDFDSFKHRADRKCELVLGDSVSITSRHYFDCNGGIYIDDYTTIAGLRTQILTHGIDLRLNRQDAEPVHIGRYCFVSTGCIVLKGASLPDYSVLSAGAVLSSPQNQEGWLYGGVPATPIKPYQKDKIAYFHRTERAVV